VDAGRTGKRAAPGFSEERAVVCRDNAKPGTAHKENEMSWDLFGPTLPGEPPLDPDEGPDGWQQQQEHEQWEYEQQQDKKEWE
jgi:hypothetical protein